MKKVQKIWIALLAIVLLGSYSIPVSASGPIQSEGSVPGSNWTAWSSARGTGCATNGACLNVSGQHRGRRVTILLIGGVESEAFSHGLSGIPSSAATTEGRAGSRGGTRTNMLWGSWRTAHTTSSITSLSGSALARTAVQIRPRFH
ncbi:MAG: hypothetical protein FWG67_02755 [Defluviitaleaceae bacterium]|nr:hypothetical protein [Defluviitaleaceae bacterium]